MLSSIISSVTKTSVKINRFNVEISQDDYDVGSNDNGDEPPPSDVSNGYHSNSSNNDNNRHVFHNKCESLNEGTFAFMCWMNSDDKKSITSDNPIVLLKFVNDKHTILYDTDLHVEVDVQISEGVPYCRHCELDDCAHVGFAVCIEELYGYKRGKGGKEETVDDIL